MRQRCHAGSGPAGGAPEALEDHRQEVVAAAGHRVAGRRLERPDDPVVADDLVGGADDEDVVERDRGSSARARPATRRPPRRRSPRRSRPGDRRSRRATSTRSTSGLPIAASDQSMITIRSSTSAALSEWKSPWTRLTGNGELREPGDGRVDPGRRRPPAASSASGPTARSGPAVGRSRRRTRRGSRAGGRSGAPAASRPARSSGRSAIVRWISIERPRARRQRRRPLGLRQARRSSASRCPRPAASPRPARSRARAARRAAVGPRGAS